MRYYIIAGEPSGDLHGANCMSELLKKDPAAEFRFTGGDRMERVAGRNADIHIREMAFMGFVDVLKHIGKIRRNFKVVKKQILEFRPHLILLIDYPGFNLRMAEWATKKGIRADYYISPTVWAWKEGRVEKIRRFTHKLFVILPFEEPFYAKHRHKVYFVGHPLMDELDRKKGELMSCSEFRSRNRLGEQPLVAVLPGSREQEITRMLDLMLEVAPQFPAWRFVVAASGSLPARFFDRAKNKGISVVNDQTYELMRCSEAGIIKSGTSTLESALFNLPQVVCYKGGALSFAIAKRIVNVKFISLVNLIMGREVVKELIQTDMTERNIGEELTKLLTDAGYRRAIQDEYEAMRALLGGGGASRRVAEHMFEDAKEIAV